MSDHFHVQIMVEMYDQHQMVFDKRGDLIVSILKNAVSDRLKEMDFPEQGFFVTASGY